MRIAYIVHSLNLGGTERLAADMSLALKDSFDMSIVCLDEPGIWAEQVREKGVAVTCLYRQPGLDFRMASGLASYARQRRIDLFHAHQCTPWFYAGLSRLLCPAPKLVFEEHGRLYPEVLNKRRKWFNRFVLQKLTHRVTAVSSDVKQRLIDYEGVCPDRIQVVYNGVKPAPPVSDADKKALRRRFGFSDQDIIAGCVGRLDPIKNLPLFINALKTARAACPDLKGIIIGDGPLYSELKTLVKTLDMQDHIRFTGYRKDAAFLIHIMDIYTLVSFSEGTSMALLEAMSAGVPAIVTRVGGNPEIVVHDQTGWMILSDDPSALTAALTNAASDVTKRHSLGRNARNRFLESFTFDRMIQQYSSIYKQFRGT